MTPKFLAHDYTIFTGYEEIVNAFFTVVGDNITFILAIFGIMWAVKVVVNLLNGAVRGKIQTFQENRVHKATDSMTRDERDDYDDWYSFNAFGDDDVTAYKKYKKYKKGNA